MHKPVSSNIVALALIIFATAFLLIAPISIEITPATTTAADTDAPVAHTHVNAKTVEYTLRTIVGQDPAMAYIGIGGDIDGVINPTLTANVGDTVRITLINGDPIVHDLKIDEFDAFSGELLALEEEVTFEFVVDRPGDFI